MNYFHFELEKVQNGKNNTAQRVDKTYSLVNDIMAFDCNHSNILRMTQSASVQTMLVL